MSQDQQVKAQGGILEGGNPSEYDPKNPVVLFIIQVWLLFASPKQHPNQAINANIVYPRVIAEVIGGILLGPSVLGRVPGFTNAIFPAESIPVLSLAANLGLILFLFLIGLEVDLRLLISNWKVALSVGVAGLALPFGLGLAIAYGLYHQFREEAGLADVDFGTYILFVGVAMGITAFPVLCRILSELNLLQTQVGVIVLSAGVGNDVVGWILLALCVALVNSGAGLTALWILLVCVGYVLFLVYAVRPAFLWILNRTGSLQHGPTQSILGLTILMVLASSFFTSIIGVHAIFGAFLIGLICPHNKGFAIKVAEKIEDLVTVLLLPLYFALSGLSTNLGLLDSGITWAYVIGVIAVAFFGKVIGGTLAARLTKLVWRESFTIGVLMSCKGLVELIVLNIGYQARILSQRTFTIFVVMALVTTFATTPLVSFLYPPWYQKKLAAWKRGDIDWEGNTKQTPDESIAEDATLAQSKDPGVEVRKLLVCLGLDSLPSLFTFVTLLGYDQAQPPQPRTHPSRTTDDKKPATKNSSEVTDFSPLHNRPLEVHGLRLLELTERLSSVMQESEIAEWSSRDPVVNVLHTFGQLNNVAVSGEVQFVAEGAYPDVIGERAQHHESDFILLPWSKSGSVSEITTLGAPELEQSVFHNSAYNQLVTKLLASAPCDTAVFVNNGFGGLPKEASQGLSLIPTSLSPRADEFSRTPALDRSHHIFVPFFGGSDDRLAVRFAMRLAKNPNVTATILLMSHAATYQNADVEAPANQDKIINSEPQEAATNSDNEQAFFYSVKDSLPDQMQSRVVFDDFNAPQTLPNVVERAAKETKTSSPSAANLIIVGRNSLQSKRAEQADDVTQALGKCAKAMISADVTASVLVIQSSRELRHRRSTRHFDPLKPSKHRA
ncbi:MAG: K(+)/H(+) antiporter [Alyxoria varia]|nr:MAG: K(+)/H(+) antiporter [Alyxoria varia]